MKIQIILFNGFDELDVIAPFEIFRMAADQGAPIQVRLVTLNKLKEVVAAHGLKVSSEHSFDENALDLLFVPGGGWVDRSPQGVRAEVERAEIPQVIGRVHRSGKIIAGVCTGVMLLCAAGILKGRHAVTHQGALDDLKAAGAKVILERVVDDRDIITAGGVTSGIDLALYLVERFAGGSYTEEIKKTLEYHSFGKVWKKGIG